MAECNKPKKIIHYVTRRTIASHTTRLSKKVEYMFIYSICLMITSFCCCWTQVDTFSDGIFYVIFTRSFSADKFFNHRIKQSVKWYQNTEYRPMPRSCITLFSRVDDTWHTNSKSTSKRHDSRDEMHTQTYKMAIWKVWKRVGKEIAVRVKIPFQLQ